MKIIFEENQIDRIASDDAGGKFYVGADGRILYLGPVEIEPWYVNSNADKFQCSVRAYEKYGTAVAAKETEEEQLKSVAEFKQEILAIENYASQNKSYWSCIVQQAEEGQV